jgi:glucose/arabinose dehydrogenase
MKPLLMVMACLLCGCPVQTALAPGVPSGSARPSVTPGVTATPTSSAPASVLPTSSMPPSSTTTTGYRVTTLAADLSQVSMVAVDRSGTVYAAGNGSAYVRKLSPTGEPSDLDLGMSIARALAVAPDNSLYVGYGTAKNSIEYGILHFGSAGPQVFTMYNSNGGAVPSYGEPVAIAFTPTGQLALADNQALNRLSSDGSVTQPWSKFGDPSSALAIDADGTAYLAQPARHRVLKIDAKGNMKPLGDNGQGFADGPLASAQFNTPTGVAVDSQHNVYVADAGNNRIRRIGADGIVATIAGDGTAGFADGQAGLAKFNGPSGLAVGAGGEVYVADTANGRIRKILPGSR